MYKVFLVEDEAVIREGLRDNIPWEQFGFTFAGEAGDGEIALPMIRRERPDLLITDIRMPFMDGLALSRVVRSELPATKIVILSGFNDFEYARKAIEIGVDLYLTKPVTRKAMQEALLEIRKKIEAAQKNDDYQQRFRDEQHEYEQFRRRRFFENVFAGGLSVEEIYREANKLSIDVIGPCYNLILYELAGQGDHAASGYQPQQDQVYQCQEELAMFFLKYPEYLFFQWGTNIFCAVVKGDADTVDRFTALGMQRIEESVKHNEAVRDWHVCSGERVIRFSALSECYALTSRIFAFRFFMPDEHVLTQESLRTMDAEREAGSLETMDPAMADQETIRSFLRSGRTGEVKEFVDGLCAGLKEALHSRIFRDYFLLNVRFAVQSFAGEEGGDADSLLRLKGDELARLSSDVQALQRYVTELIGQAIALREQKEGAESRGILKKALHYIDENYTDDALSLSSVAEVTDTNPSYFSALFSQKMDVTFVEYVTGKRMEKARELLRQSGASTADVAAAVGYRDSHYFSFVFKKTCGCTPREYRQSSR